MQSYDLTEFLKLSAVLHYQLSAKAVNWNSVATVILGERTVSNHDHEVLLRVFNCLSRLYGERKRNLGTPSVLHPLRSTALLSHASQDVNLMDLMTSLLHDTLEDVRSDEGGDSDNSKLDANFQEFLSEIPPDQQECLMERLNWLTKEPGETYYRYIGRLLEQANSSPEVVRVKLADRLDNTLDMRVDLEDPLQGVDFFENVFQMLFTSTYRGYRPVRPHRSTMALNGAERLYQLFKNIVLMSLVRQKRVGDSDHTRDWIFNALATASMREAQRIALHIFGYHETGVPVFRDLLIDTMKYAQAGGINEVTSPAGASRLDGLFVSVFDNPDHEARSRKLAPLYRDKPLMIETSIAFIAIFLSFMNDPDFFVHGISTEGVRPQAG